MFQLLVCLVLAATAQGQLVNYAVGNLCAQYGWPNGNYPHPYDCHQYIAFNPNTRNCDNYGNGIWGSLCNYNNPVPVNGGYQYPVYANNVCGQYGWGNGNFYHPYDCTKYVQCSNGVTTVMSCPQGLYYNPAIKTCSANAVGNCQQYVFVPPPSQVVYPNNGVDNFCGASGLANGIHPDPYTCYGYIECTFGVTNHMPCPTGLAFNPSILVCDDLRNVNCQGNYLVPGVGKK